MIGSIVYNLWQQTNLHPRIDFSFLLWLGVNIILQVCPRKYSLEQHEVTSQFLVIYYATSFSLSIFDCFWNLKIIKLKEKNLSQCMGGEIIVDFRARQQYRCQVAICLQAGQSTPGGQLIRISVLHNLKQQQWIPIATCLWWKLISVNIYL